MARRKTIQDKNRIPALLKELENLNKLHVEIGVFGEGKSYDKDRKEVRNEPFVLMIARVHEFGVDIEPKNGKYLTIPLPAAKGTKAGDYDDLFIPHGTNILARPKGKDGFEPMFALVERVTIPERSYMRSTYDEKEKDLEPRLKKLLAALMKGKIDAKELYERIGIWLVMQVQRKIRDIKDPANSEATKATKRSSNPLIDTGRLIQSISYRVVKG